MLTRPHAWLLVCLLSLLSYEETLFTARRQTASAIWEEGRSSSYACSGVCYVESAEPPSSSPLGLPTAQAPTTADLFSVAQTSLSTSSTASASGDLQSTGGTEEAPEVKIWKLWAQLKLNRARRRGLLKRQHNLSYRWKSKEVYARTRIRIQQRQSKKVRCTLRRAFARLRRPQIFAD